MPRRSITDDEIALIRAMLARGMRNHDIQFYFNRQDRPVNAGRISEIRNGTYGPGIQTADTDTLDSFLTSFASSEVGVVIESNTAGSRQSLAERAKERFEHRNDEHWYLIDGETSEQECKEIYDRRRMNSIVKAIGALANNQGGYIFVGVSDAGYRVTGLADATFADTDIATFSDKVKTFLRPTPIFSKDIVDLDGIQVGVIQVEKHTSPPVVVCRDGEGLTDGTILFRYPGQSASIKSGDLHVMLEERDRHAHHMLLSRAARLSRIGAHKALIVDTQKARLDAGETWISIDRELADQLEFIREGEFEEREGAPTLRLVGDVMAVDTTGQVRERIEGRALTPDMAVKAYLRRERVSSPIAYICLSAHVQRQWLPLHYFVGLSGQNVETAILALELTEEAVYRNSKQKALQRLRGQRSAFAPLSGSAAPVGADIQAGFIDGIGDRHHASLIARAIQGLPDNFNNVSPVLELLDALHDQYQADPAIRGLIYRAASRLDEIEALAAQRSDT